MYLVHAVCENIIHSLVQGRVSVFTWCYLMPLIVLTVNLFFFVLYVNTLAHYKRVPDVLQLKST
jgi:hypothetical protein